MLLASDFSDYTHLAFAALELSQEVGERIA